MNHKQDIQAFASRALGIWVAFVFFVLFGFGGVTSWGHRPGETYLFLKVHENAMEARVEAMLNDLNRGLNLDQNVDGKVNPEEFAAQLETVRAYIEERISIGPTNGPAFALVFTNHTITNVTQGQYAMLEYRVEVEAPLNPVIAVEDRVLFDGDPPLTSALIIETNFFTGRTNSIESVMCVFNAEHPRQVLDLANPPSRGTVFLRFVWEGVWHIWIGLDHILFLLSLILPAVLIFGADRKWKPVEGFRPAMWQIVKIVTLFTVAHSITLSLASLNVVTINPRWVESIIAFSVVVAAVNNLRPFMLKYLGFLIFGFGLFHGFGFASVLGHLGLTSGSLAMSLLGFNIGVELGQLAIILAAFPVIYFFRKFKGYLWFMWVGSGFVALIAMVWFVQRAFELE